MTRIAEKALLPIQWNNREDEEAFWCQQARDIVLKKSKIRRRNDYHDYGKNWLLLWDELSIFPDTLELRAELLQRVWDRYWRSLCGFDLIVLECEELKQFAILSPDHIRFLPNAAIAI